MAPDKPSKAFLEEYNQLQGDMKDTMNKYVAAWMSGDLETVLSYFSDSNLDYSDYGLMALHMDKKALISYFQFMGSLFGDMDIRTTSIRGAVNFCVWECVFEFTVLKSDPGVPYKVGERGKIMNASVIEWADGKIVKESDYAVWGNQPGHADIGDK